MLKTIVRALTGSGSASAAMTYQEASIEALHEPGTANALRAVLVAMQGGPANTPRARAVSRQLVHVDLALRRHAVAAEWDRARKQTALDMTAAEKAAAAATAAVTAAREQAEAAAAAADRAARRADEMRQSIADKRAQATTTAQRAIDKATADLQRAEESGDDGASQLASNALMVAKRELAGVASEGADDLRLAALVSLSAATGEAVAKAEQSLTDALQRHGAAEFARLAVLFDRNTLQMVESWLSMVQAVTEAGFSKELGSREFAFWMGSRDRFPLGSRFEGRFGPVPSHVLTELKLSVEPVQAAVFAVDPQTLPDNFEDAVAA